MTDPMDLVREFYRAVNRNDAAGVAAFYHPSCIVEHVFTDDAATHRGRTAVAAAWASELETFAGALPGGVRFDVSRVAGIETGWGWVRSDWVSAVRAARNDPGRYSAGHSHFWIEDGLIVRHRSVARAIAAPEVLATEAPSERHYPSRPLVGVGAVVLAEAGKVVLVKRAREPLAGQWSLPGGMLELGETLEAGTAREILEETGLVVEVGPAIEVFDRILVDDEGRVRYHFVLVDYLCRPRAGVLEAGTDVDAVTLADPEALAGYEVTDKVGAVVARAVALNREYRW